MAEDLVQATFSAAWRGWRSGPEGKAQRSWLFTLLVDQWRAHSVDGRICGNDRFDERLLGLESHTQTMADIREGLWNMPVHLRTALTLQILGRYLPTEVAALLGVDQQEGSSRLANARIMLRRWLDGRSVERQQAA